MLLRYDAQLCSDENRAFVHGSGSDVMAILEKLVSPMMTTQTSMQSNRIVNCDECGCLQRSKDIPIV